MKKAQTMVEYTILLIIFTILCIGITALLNREAIVRGATFGVEVQNTTLNKEQVHVPSMDVDEEF